MEQWTILRAAEAVYRGKGMTCGNFQSYRMKQEYARKCGGPSQTIVDENTDKVAVLRDIAVGFLSFQPPL